MSEAQCGRLNGSGGWLLLCRSGDFDVCKGFFVDLVVEGITIALTELLLTGEEQAWLDRAASERTIGSGSSLASE